MAADEKPVLIAYDGSDHAKQAIEQAGSELRTPRKAVVVAAYEPLEALPFWGRPAAIVPDELAEQAGKEAAKTAAEGAELANSAGFDASSRVHEERSGLESHPCRGRRGWCRDHRSRIARARRCRLGAPGKRRDLGRTPCRSPRDDLPPRRRQLGIARALRGDTERAMSQENVEIVRNGFERYRTTGEFADDLVTGTSSGTCRTSTAGRSSRCTQAQRARELSSRNGRMRGRTGNSRWKPSMTPATESLLSCTSVAGRKRPECQLRCPSPRSGRSVMARRPEWTCTPIQTRPSKPSGWRTALSGSR